MSCMILCTSDLKTCSVCWCQVMFQESKGRPRSKLGFELEHTRSVSSAIHPTMRDDIFRNRELFTF